MIAPSCKSAAATSHRCRRRDIAAPRGTTAIMRSLVFALSVAATTADVECDAACFSAIVAEARRARAARDNVSRASSTSASATYTVRDLWQRKDLAPCEHCAETGYTVRNLASNAAALLTFAEAH